MMLLVYRMHNPVTTRPLDYPSFERLSTVRSLRRGDNGNNNLYDLELYTVVPKSNSLARHSHKTKRSTVDK